MRSTATERHMFSSRAFFFARTLPGGSKTILFSTNASKRNSKAADNTSLPLRLSLIDIKKAYFKGVPAREIYMSLPPELGRPKHLVATQASCVYGTCDAGMIWEQCYRDASENIGFINGVPNPCLFIIRHESLQLLGTVMTSPR